MKMFLKILKMFPLKSLKALKFYIKRGVRTLCHHEKNDIVHVRGNLAWRPDDDAFRAPRHSVDDQL